jgi:hypothetical protein
VRDASRHLRHENRAGLARSRHARCRESAAAPLGTTPLRVDLPADSYLCNLKAPGKRDTRYPVKTECGNTWKGAVVLKTDDEIGESFVHVPFGPLVYGECGKTPTSDLPDFAIAETPVTFRAYLEVLPTLDDEEAERRKPRMPGCARVSARTSCGRSARPTAGCPAPTAPPR